MWDINKPCLTPYRYICNGIDVTVYVMNKLPLPKGLNDKFFEIKVVRG